MYMDAIKLYNEHVHSTVHSLRDLQLEALNILTRDKDCICALPTGYGKSLIYELLPFINIGCLVIVIVPLNAIMDQQLRKLGDLACSLAPGQYDMNKLKTGGFSYLFCHPEQILHNSTFHQLLCSETYNLRKVYLVVDEAHCILEWGEDFRRDYQQLYELRSIFACTVLALSATITQDSMKKIARSLHIQSYESVCGCPAKDNIVLMVKRRPSPTAKGQSAVSPYDYIFKPIIEQLREQLDSFKITIIYCKSMQWLGHGYEMARRILGESFFNGEPTPHNARVVMYHSSMEKEPGKLKSMILTSLQKPDEECNIRLIFASVALGMGADLTSIKRVVHAGPPTSLETYVQEIGRAGRTGSPAEAILYFNNTDVAQPAIRKDMKNFCIDTVRCRRDIINEYFGFTKQAKPYSCCNYCDEQLGLVWDFSSLALQ